MRNFAQNGDNLKMHDDNLELSLKRAAPLNAPAPNAPVNNGNVHPQDGGRAQVGGRQVTPDDDDKEGAP